MGKSKSLMGLVLAGAMACSINAQNADNRDRKPTGKGIGTRFFRPGSSNEAGPEALQGTSGNGISYHGGPVMLGTINVYYILYGAWGPKQAALLKAFGQNIGGSPYFDINTTYYDGNAQHVGNSVSLSGVTTDSYSHGKSLSDSAVQAVVSGAINGGKLPLDPSGVYFVLTSADVNETSGFCTAYCGWHTSATINGQDVKYAFVGNAARCLSACAAAQTTSPNGLPGVDAMISVVAHELEESATDPDGDAWYDGQGNENADKCAWTFGTTYPTSNGASANMNLGGKNYQIQQNWVNANGGACALKYP